jgi:hypothetical protein
MLGRYARVLLVYLYYALDNRPWYFGPALGAVAMAGRLLSRIRHPPAREAVTWMIATGVHMPLVALGALVAPLGLED